MGTITPRIVGYKVQLLINRIYNKFQNSKCLLRNSFEWKRFVALLRSFKKCRKYGSCVLLTPAIECRSILAIDTLIDPQLTLDRPSIDPRLAHGRHLRRQTFNFRWHSMEWRSILAMTTHWMSVDVSIATLRSAVGRMSVGDCFLLVCIQSSVNLTKYSKEIMVYCWSLTFIRCGGS